MWHYRNNTNMNEIKWLLRNAEQQYYRGQFYDNWGNSAATSKVIKKTSYRTKNQLATSVSTENELNRAEEFIKLFLDVGKCIFEKTQNTLNDMNLNHDNTQGNETYENLFIAERDDVKSIILPIKHFKKTPSRLPEMVLHLAIFMTHCLLSLTSIINTPLFTGRFFSLWKHTTVIPVFKNDDRNDVNIYRQSNQSYLRSQCYRI